MEHLPGTVALVGPGRAGTALALALAEQGWKVVAVAGRSPEAASTRIAAAALDAPARLVSEVGRGACLVLVATPDAAVGETALATAAALQDGALVVHLAGSLGLDVLAPLAARRPEVRLGALHPLQSLPSASVGLRRLRGSWAAVAGDPEVSAIARSLGLRTFAVADDVRAQYHATAVTASNHLVALLGQVERMAATCGVPFEAFVPLARASLENVVALGPGPALTGPVARGDLATVQRHLAALAPAERDAYRALAREAARLVGGRPGGLDRLLSDVRAAEEDRDP